MKFINLKRNYAIWYEKIDNFIRVQFVEYSGDCRIIITQIDCFTIHSAIRNIKHLRKGYTL